MIQSLEPSPRFSDTKLTSSPNICRREPVARSISYSIQCIGNYVETLGNDVETDVEKDKSSPSQSSIDFFEGQTGPILNLHSCCVKAKRSISYFFPPTYQKTNRSQGVDRMYRRKHLLYHSWYNSNPNMSNAQISRNRPGNQRPTIQSTP
jgi:hypothetical protein